MDTNTTAVKHNLTTTSMLVNIHIHVWPAKKTDKTIGKEVHDKYEIEAGKQAGKYGKFLIDINHPAYKAVCTAGSQARATFYAETLPWGDDGARVLPMENYEEFTKVMRARKMEFEQKMGEFLQIYPELRAQARHDLKAMFNFDDYPSEEKMTRKFGVEYSIQPLPDKNDFRVNFGDETVNAIRKQIENETQLAINEAVTELWSRFYIPIAKLATTLTETAKNGKDKTFRDTLMTNIKDVCHVLPRFNLTHDSKLTEMCERIERELLIYTPDDLRKDKFSRREVAQKAQAIADDLAAFMSY